MKKIQKSRFMSKEGLIKSYSFVFLKRRWVISLSQSKWHDGDRYRKMPIWFSTINNQIRFIFIWNLAIGLEKTNGS